MKKAVILSPYANVSNEGGPPGFIATNYEGHQLPNCDIAFIKDYPPPRASKYKSICSRISFAFCDPVLSRLKQSDAHASFPWIQSLGTQSKALYTRSNASDYEAVIFHDLISLFFCLPLIPNSQHVILYPHMPELLHEEMVTFGAKPDSPLVEWVKTVVNPACFSRADSIFLPNAGVLEIYAPVINERSMVYFLASGSSLTEVPSTIPLDPGFTTFLYIGRRHSIKGFDLILEAFEEAFQINPQLRLLLAGKGSLYQRPGVVDLQFTSCPHVWMKSVDCVVNFNRQSYFDRSIIEALSVGARLLVACSHGHSELMGASPGIFGIPSANRESLIEAFLKIAAEGFPKGSRAANQELYITRYSDACHRQQLEAVLNSILQS